jgi:negative regulator of flagellin synthesis FlgM
MDITKLDRQGIDAYQVKAERLRESAPRSEVEREARAGGEEDKVQLSHEALLRGTARSTAMQTEDVRAERVEELKAQVAGGTYKIDARTIAAKLLREEVDLFR